MKAATAKKPHVTIGRKAVEALGAAVAAVGPALLLSLVESVETSPVGLLAAASTLGAVVLAPPSAVPPIAVAPYVVAPFVISSVAVPPFAVSKRANP